MDASVQLKHMFTSRLLMQSVDILCHDRFQLSFFLQLSQLVMCRIGLRIQNEHFIPVEPVKFLRMPLKKRMAQNRLRRIVILHMIQPVHASEIRDTALRRHARTAEKDNIVAAVDPLF